MLKFLIEYQSYTNNMYQEKCVIEQYFFFSFFIYNFQLVFNLNL